MQVCSSSNDPLWAVNLKKGVLSAFQQSISSSTVQENVTETDVVGRQGELLPSYILFQCLQV